MKGCLLEVGPLCLNSEMVKYVLIFPNISNQDIIDNTTCRNPYEMTEDQLVNELTERGKDSKGSREQLVERLVKSDKCNGSANLFSPHQNNE